MSTAEVNSTAVRAIRYRVLPGTPAKAKAMNRLAGACRYVWNGALRANRDAHRMSMEFGGRVPSPTFFTLGKSFIALRNSEGHEWLRELPCGIVRYTLKRQADAWQAFFKGQRARPKIHGRRHDGGFTIPEKVRIRDGRVAIPKIGGVRLRRRGGNPHPDGSPKQAVFKREGRKWYCTVFYAVDVAGRTDDGTAVGMDRNVGQVATSEGKIIRLPSMDRLEARRRRYQRRMARQVKGSNRRGRTKAKLARTSRRIADIRANWAHRVSRNLADRYHAVVIEDLRTKAMSASAKGTADSPGRNVRQKASLNRGIQASAWGGLERNLAYKAGRLLRVHPAHTSQTCNECGAVDSASRMSQSEFRCQACGHSANADVNAARNIRRQGLAQLDGEGRRRRRTKGSLASPMTRQIGMALAA